MNWIRLIWILKRNIFWHLFYSSRLIFLSSLRIAWQYFKNGAFWHYSHIFLSSSRMRFIFFIGMDAKRYTLSLLVLQFSISSLWTIFFFYLLWQNTSSFLFKDRHYITKQNQTKKFYAFTSCFQNEPRKEIYARIYVLTYVWNIVRNIAISRCSLFVQ